MVVNPVVTHKGLFAFWGLLFLLCAGIASFTACYWVIAMPFAGLLVYFGWQQPQLIFFLLLASIPFSFEYMLTETIGTDMPDELLMLLVSGLFFSYILYHRNSLPVGLWKHPLIILFSFWLLWMIVSSAFSTHILVSIKYLLAKTWYAGAFLLAPLIIFKKPENMKTAALVLLASMITVAVLIFIKHWQKGLSFVSVNDAVAPFFRNHVNYSSLLVCCIPLAAACWRLGKNGKLKALLIACMVFILVALFFSYARGAWLALGVGAISSWLIKKRLLPAVFIAGILFAVAALFWLKQEDKYVRYAPHFNTTIFHENFSEHLAATYQLKDISTAERFNRWIAGVRMIKYNWLTGYGPATFYNNYKEYTIPAYKTWVSDNPEKSTVHNYFLLVAVEMGLPGLLFFLILVGAMLWYVQKLYRRFTDKFYKTIVLTAGVILSMIITLNLLSDLIETDKVGSLFFLCLSVLIMLDILYPTKTLKAQSEES